MILEWIDSCISSVEQSFEPDHRMEYAREELLLVEELLGIIRVSHDAGLYNVKDGKCRVCEILAALTLKASNTARPTAPDRVTQAALDKLEGR